MGLRQGLLNRGLGIDLLLSRHFFADHAVDLAQVVGEGIGLHCGRAGACSRDGGKAKGATGFGRQVFQAGAVSIWPQRHGVDHGNLVACIAPGIIGGDKGGDGSHIFFAIAEHDHRPGVGGDTTGNQFIQPFLRTAANTGAASGD